MVQLSAVVEVRTVYAAWLEGLPRMPGAITSPEQQLQPASSEFSDDTNTTVDMEAVLTGNMCFVGKMDHSKLI